MRHKLFSVPVIVLAAVLLAVFGWHLALAKPPSPSLEVAKPDLRVILVAQEGEPALSFAPPPREFRERLAQTSTFTIVWRTDGACEAWLPEAQAAFEHAVAIWESIVSSPVPIQVNACWEDLTASEGAGVLGSAGAADYAYDFPNAPYAHTWYPIALANALAGADLSPAMPDIDASFNSTFDRWYFGTGDSTPAGEYSFATAVLHEICHGLGFFSGMSRFQAGAYWGQSGMPIVFDHFVENGAGEILMAKYPSAGSTGTASVWLLNELTSNDVFFDGPYANAANGFGRPQLYAPSEWKAGSSISHLDEQYNAPDPNALMTYSLASGETTHDPGPVVKGMFEDIGWKIRAAVPQPTPEPVSAVIPISGGVITTAYQTTTTILFSAGSVAEAVTVTLALTNTGPVTRSWEAVGTAFTLDAVRVSDGTPVSHVTKAVTVTIAYGDRDVWGVVENTLMLYRLGQGGWITATTTCDPMTTVLHNREADVFSAGICQLGKFALFGQTQRVYLPLLFK